MANYNLAHSWQQVDDATEQAIQTADFVVEKGSSGIWTWRKWNSGVAECWGTKDFTVAVTNPWGALFESPAQNVNYPSGLFNAAPTALVSPGGNASFVEVSGFGTASVTPNLFVVRPVSTASNSYKINIHAIGKWK